MSAGISRRTIFPKIVMGLVVRCEVNGGKYRRSGRRTYRDHPLATPASGGSLRPAPHDLLRVVDACRCPRAMPAEQLPVHKHESLAGKASEGGQLVGVRLLEGE